jgi:hypothetical protein
MILFILDNIDCIDDICHLILGSPYNFLYMIYFFIVINGNEQNDNENENENENEIDNL